MIYGRVVLYIPKGGDSVEGISGKTINRITTHVRLGYVFDKDSLHVAYPGYAPTIPENDVSKSSTADFRLTYPLTVGTDLSR